jgi:hypothetical protein
MTKCLTCAAVFLGLVIAGPALSQTTTPPLSGAPQAKLSEAQCEVVWARIIDVASPGSITPSQAQGTLSDFKGADTNNDGVVSHAEFLVACDKGMVSDTASGSRALAPPPSSTPEPKK